MSRHIAGAATVVGFLEDIDMATDWTGALCRETDPDLFCPPDDGERGFDYTAGKAICRICPLIDRCLEYSLEHDERYGLWGGKTPRERQRIVAERAGQVA